MEERSPSAVLMAIATVGPGLLGGFCIILGLPSLLVLLLVAGAAGFFVAHPGGGRAPLSALAGAGACLVALLGVAAPFVPTLLTDAEFRHAALNLTGLAGGIIVVVLGFGALVGYGGAFVARDVARRTAAPK